MNISIGIIKINSISSIGSLNIGKTILCKNESNSVSYGSEEAVEDGMQVEVESSISPVTTTPTPPAFPASHVSPATPAGPATP